MQPHGEQTYHVGGMSGKTGTNNGHQGTLSSPTPIPQLNQFPHHTKSLPVPFVYPYSFTNNNFTKQEKVEHQLDQ